MKRWKLAILYCALVLMVDTCPGELFARGRSFPGEVIGTIIQVDRLNKTFTIRPDGSAQILSIALGKDYKFKGAPAPREQVLRPGARLRVCYHATLFAGNIAVEIEPNPPPNPKAGSY